MKRKLLVVDTETAGLDASQHSILSFAAVVYQDGGIAGEFHTLVRESPLCVQEMTAEERANGLKDAIEVNGIKMVDLLDAPWPWLAVQKFTNWLAANELYGPQMLVAHKASFDVAFLQRLWRLAEADFEKQFGHRHLCTQTAALLLDQAGRIDLPGGSSSLDNVAAVFGLQRHNEKHDALEDARLCARVLAKMVERIR